MKIAKIAVVGSRSFTNQDLLFDALDNLSKHVPECSKIDLVVSGGAVGADKFAEQYAKQKGIPLKAYLPEYARYGRTAPLKRNYQIIDSADLVFAFWDGKSRRTKYSIDKAKNRWFLWSYFLWDGSQYSKLLN